MLQRHQVICRVIDGLELIQWNAAAIGRVDQTDVALGAAVKKSALIDLVVNPYQPRVFMHGGGYRGRELVAVGSVRG